MKLLNILAIGATFASALSAQTQALIQNYALAGLSRTVEWTNLSSSNVGLAANPIMSDGVGALTVQSPGYQASVGFYAFSGAYGFTASTTLTPFDVGTVVLQYAGGHNPDFDSQYLSFNGGPVLTYTYSGGSGVLAPTHSAQPAGPVTLTVGAFTSDYYDHAWEWDLSALPQSISGLSVVVPVPVHTSLTNVQLQFGDTYAGLLAPVPEPASAALLGGCFALGCAVLRRRRQAR
jgi:hypothetical protein